MTALLVMTDGRLDCLERTITSARDMLRPFPDELWLHDDTGEDAYREILQTKFPDFRHIAEGPRRGFGGAYSHAWSCLALESQADYIFSTEDDFTFNRLVSLIHMSCILREHPYLLQLALRRQPWSAAEIAAGGVIEQNPDDFEEKTHKCGSCHWLEHRRFWTTNPSLFPASLLDFGWPNVPRSEGMQTSRMLMRGADTRFGYWGARDSGEWVTHIGEERNGSGY